MIDMAVPWFKLLAEPITPLAQLPSPAFYMAMHAAVHACLKVIHHVFQHYFSHTHRVFVVFNCVVYVFNRLIERIGGTRR